MDRRSDHRLMESQPHRKPLGLDFDKYPAMCKSLGIHSVLEYASTPESYDWFVFLATMAIKEYFGPNEIERAVMTITDVNGCEHQNSSYSYYITFIVDNNGMQEVFQAEVVLTSPKALKVAYCTHKF